MGPSTTRRLVGRIPRGVSTHRSGAQRASPPREVESPGAGHAEFVICDCAIELGFRALKGVGWQWQQTRRTEPTRVARHWLVLAVAMVWVLAYGTRVEDAAHQGVPPAGLRTPPPVPAHSTGAGGRQRLVSLFRLGRSWLRTTLGRGYLWRCLWLTPEPWPASLPQLYLTDHLVA
jgi:hypothetical protein